MRQNLFFAFFYNAIGVPLAAAVLYPFFDLLLNSIFAAVMSLSSVSVSPTHNTCGSSICKGLFLHMKILTRNQQMA